MDSKVEDLLAKCIVFDQDCFYDLRMVAAERRQELWVKEYLPDLSNTPAENYSQPSAFLGDAFLGEQFLSRKEIMEIDHVSHEILRNVHVKRVELLGSTQDGLYLEQGFPVVDDDRSGINSSDIDVVYEYTGIDVLENHGGEAAIPLHLCLVSTQYPGYFKMKICHPTFIEKRPRFFRNLYLKLKLFKDLECAQFYVSRGNLSETRNMAALHSNIDDELGIHEIDNVAAFKLPKWPRVAESFLTRYRPSGWPSKELLQTVSENGCGFVAKGRECADLEYQWRISFASSEKILSRSLKPCQIRTYLFFKSLCKRSLRKPKGLSSYMLKNVLFWTIETIDQELWTSDNLLYCLEALVFTLSEFLGNKIIPSFFLPSINLVREISHKNVHDLASKARRLQKNIFDNIIQITEWKNFRGHCEISLSLLSKKLPCQRELDSLCSAAYFSLYLYLRLQVMRYKMKLSTQTLSMALASDCRSVCSKLVPRAAEYLVEALKLQPDPELYGIETSPQGQIVLRLDGMRRKVVEFWHCPFYTGIFSKMRGDSIVEFENFMGSRYQFPLAEPRRILPDVCWASE